MSNEQIQQGATKKVEITLTATTSVQYTEIVEVPADISPEDLNKVVNQLYEKVGADEYSTVGDSWERGYCGAEETQSTEPATLSAARTEGGILLADASDKYAKIRASATHCLKESGQLRTVDLVQMHDQVFASLATTNGDTGVCFVEARQLVLLLGAVMGQLRVYEPIDTFDALYGDIRKNADYGDRPEGQLADAELAQLQATVDHWLSQSKPQGLCKILARQLALLLAAVVK